VPALRGGIGHDHDVLTIETPLRLTGYWASAADETWPDPRALVDPAWGGDERELLSIYLRYGLIVRAWMGPSTCRFCAASVGNLELTDGEYVWPEGLAHYVADHDVRLPEEFVAHVHEMEQRLESVSVDPAWWRTHGAMES
jgi:hypothetical protein